MDLFLNGSIDETTGERQDYQFGFLHIKAIDETGHDKNMPLRLVWLEKIDKMLEHLVNKWSSVFRDQGMDMTIAITGDHSTPVIYGKFFRCVIRDRGPYGPPSAVRNIQCRSDAE
jgi:2,3-bisphosphoglycerate-independent phosphoglycerate mutase